MKLILVAGARPNFMKIAPLMRQLKVESEKLKVLSQETNDYQLMTIDYLLVHTGQHYDYEMSKVFFEDLDIPEPDIYLGVGSGTHAEQTAKVMIEFEKILMAEKPDTLIVVGDVNSTLACALSASKIDYQNGKSETLISKGEEGGDVSKESDICRLTSEFYGRRPLIAHVEAGLRSYDRSMPEEINRILTDTISDCFFTHSSDADENLKKEGIPQDKIFLVGNIMADNLLYNIEKAKKSNIIEKLGLQKESSATDSSLTNDCQPVRPSHTGGLVTDYCLLTLHRPSGVDQKDAFLRIINALTEIGKDIPVIFPAHPRTRKMITEFKLQRHFIDLTNDQRQIINNGIYLVNSFGFLDFLNIMMHSTFVITDSGGGAGRNYSPWHSLSNLERYYRKTHYYYAGYKCVGGD